MSLHIGFSQEPVLTTLEHFETNIFRNIELKHQMKNCWKLKKVGDKEILFIIELWELSLLGQNKHNYFTSVCLSKVYFSLFLFRSLITRSSLLASLLFILLWKRNNTDKLSYLPKVTKVQLYSAIIFIIWTFMFLGSK